jgi:hypothetical protein
MDETAVDCPVDLEGNAPRLSPNLTIYEHFYYASLFNIIICEDKPRVAIQTLSEGRSQRTGHCELCS